MARTGGADQAPDAEDELTGAGIDAANAFADRRRVILRGNAGTGKTTLLQWLAATGAAGRLAGDGGHWGEVIRVHVDPKGNVWVFHRCFNVEPAGQATCIGRGPANPPILEFDPSGKLLKSLGAGLFAYNHGFTVCGDGNLWATDVND